MTKTLELSFKSSLDKPVKLQLPQKKKHRNRASCT